MLEFASVVFLVSLAVSFLRTLAIKWGILEWLQVNVTNPFLSKLFRCAFCQSFWLGLVICIFLAIFGQWYYILVPICSCNIQWD